MAARQLMFVIVYIHCILLMQIGKPMSATGAAADDELSVEEIERLEGLELQKLQMESMHDTQAVPDYISPFVQHESPVRVRFEWPSQLRRRHRNRRHLLQGASESTPSEKPAGTAGEGGANNMQGSNSAATATPDIAAEQQAAAPAAAAAVDKQAATGGATPAAGPAPTEAVPVHNQAEAPSDAAAEGQLGMAAAPTASQSGGTASTPGTPMEQESLATEEDSVLLRPAATAPPDDLEQLGTAVQWNMTGSSGNLSDLEPAGGSKKPGKPGPDLPPIDPKPVGPKPPCKQADGLKEVNGVCVCKPGFGVNAGFKSCSPCLKGWVSLGGPVTTAHCRPCPELTTSNDERTACVTIIDVPDVNDALCSKCFDRLKPFDPPACCPKGQVCCGKYGCCHPQLCFNNVTTGNEPFCCEGGNCPFDQSSPLNCCPSGTTCLNITVNPTANGGQQCCPIGGECRASPDVAAVCCNPLTQFCFRTETKAATTGVVTATSVCCSNAQTTCGAIGSGDARCCDVGKFCVNNQFCCNSTSSEICLTPGTTTSVCCDPPSQCLPVPFSHAKYCCALPNNVVCGTTCCQTYPSGTNVCLNDNTCCPVGKVCTSPLIPTLQTCCSSSQACNATTGQCR